MTRAAATIRTAAGRVRDCRLAETWRRVRDGAREPFWAELGSGLGAIGCGVASWLNEMPLEQHPVFGTLARIVGGHTVEAVWMIAGALQIVALVADRWPWRWLAALGMTFGWSVPVIQAVKTGADAPIVFGACLAWAGVNAAAAWCIMRRGTRPLGPSAMMHREVR